ncbi:MAG: hypothetical protein PF487_05305 [Bacteroidales bacterium]|jgi:hypothetical protein|nr:hypothetical protein [Bacteroidales bacterium]
MEAPVNFKEILPFLLIGLAAIILLLVIIYIIRKIKKKEPIIKISKPSEPPYIIALRGLNNLKKQKLWQEGKIKMYHTKLTDIVRTYMFNRYNIKTYERTSAEILVDLKTSDFKDDDSYNLLKDVFYISDIVKFAKYSPLASDNELCLENALKFIENTKSPEEDSSERKKKKINDKSKSDS